MGASDPIDARIDAARHRGMSNGRGCARCNSKTERDVSLCRLSLRGSTHVTSVGQPSASPPPARAGQGAGALDDGRDDDVGYGSSYL